MGLNRSNLSLYEENTLISFEKLLRIDINNFNVNEQFNAF